MPVPWSLEFFSKVSRISLASSRSLMREQGLKLYRDLMGVQTIFCFLFQAVSWSPSLLGSASSTTSQRLARTEYSSIFRRNKAQFSAPSSSGTAERGKPHGDEGYSMMNWWILSVGAWNNSLWDSWFIYCLFHGLHSQLRLHVWKCFLSFWAFEENLLLNVISDTFWLIWHRIQWKFQC